MRIGSSRIPPTEQRSSRVEDPGRRLLICRARSRRHARRLRLRTTTPATRPRPTAGRGLALRLHARPARDEERGHADGRHRQAGVPAVLRGQRPDQRQGLRERDRLRDRRASSATRADEVEWTVVPVQRLLRPGAEGLRLRRQPDLDHPEARRAGRLLRALLRGRAGDRREEGLRPRRAPPRSPTSGREHRRPDRDHEPRRGQRR